MFEDKKTFCILPWIHMATYTDGSALLCCVAKNSHRLNLNSQTVSEIWNSEHFKEARRKMLAGETVSACDHCYKEEAAGIRSHRINENHIWHKKLGKEYIDNLIASTDSTGHLDKDVITFDFRLGNTCNLQCVMCRPQDSSKWVNDAKKLAETLDTDAKWDWQHKAQIDISQFEWYRRDKIWQDFEHMFPYIKHMIFAGGEPLLIKEHHALLKRLVEKGYSKEIELRYHTNGTTLPEEILELWEEFKFVEVMISLDAWGEINDYVRRPAKWHDIDTNLTKLDQTSDKIDVKILSTIHAMNIYNTPDFAKSLLERDFKKIGKKHHDGLFHAGTTHWPKYLCTKILPVDVKEKIRNYWNTHDDLMQLPQWRDKIQHQIDFMFSEDHSEMFPQMIDYIKKIDKLHNTDFEKTFPDYARILF